MARFILFSVPKNTSGQLQNGRKTVLWENRKRPGIFSTTGGGQFRKNKNPVPGKSQRSEGYWECRISRRGGSGEK